MGYYLMRVSRKSHVDILVRANTADEANKNLDDWFDDRDNYDFNELMAERETDDTNIVKYFDTIEEYNRSGKIADFEIDMSPKQTEPRYDLYLIIDEEPCHFHRKVWQDITMESVLNILKEYDKQYILKRSAAQYNVMRDALKRNCEVLCYTCERREYEDRPDISSRLEVRFDTKLEAENVLEYLKDHIGMFGCASIHDLDSAMLRETEYRLTKYGWKDLTDAHVSKLTDQLTGKEYFTIFFPKVICLDD